MKMQEDVTVTVHDDSVHDDSSERNEEVSDHVKASSASKDMSSIKSGFDHFNDEETDPKKTNSMSMFSLSCLSVHFFILQLVLFCIAETTKDK